MEAKEDGILVIQKHMVEAHMIQHFQTLHSSPVVVVVVVVVEILHLHRVEEEVMEEQPFVYLPLIRLRLMAQF